LADVDFPDGELPDENVESENVERDYVGDVPVIEDDLSDDLDSDPTIESEPMAEAG